MPKKQKKKLSKGQRQLNVVGIMLLALLATVAAGLWSQPAGFETVIPLVFLGYAAFRIVFELTINRANVPTLATCRLGRKKIAALFKQAADRRPKKPMTIIDLGSGRGELTRRIARMIPTASVLGIETATIPFWHANVMQRLLLFKNLSYKQIDFWSYDCSTADGIVLYLNLRLANKAGQKLAKELKKGSTIISHTFPLGAEWTPDEVIEFRTPFKETIYVYRVG